jgi:serine/threonine protein kinase
MDHPARTGTADSGNRSPVADTTNTHLPIPRPQRTLPASVGSSPEATAGNVTAVQEGSNGGENSGMNSPRGQHDIAERSPGGRYVRFLEKLGSGAYKDVYRAFDTIEGIEVAWNVVTLAGVPKTERSRIVNEVRLLERLHHNNIISFHGSWVNREKEQVIFVTEILSSGTLKSFINKVQVIRWKIAKRWAIQILNGLQYLHSYDPPIIHRDLKCDNIFINGTTGDLRIGDLGLSTMVSNKNKVCRFLLNFDYYDCNRAFFVTNALCSSSFHYRH